MRERVTVLIISKPEQVRDGLRALLRAIPGADVVDRSCDGVLNSKLLAEYNPALILVDCNLVDTRTLGVLREGPASLEKCPGSPPFNPPASAQRVAKKDMDSLVGCGLPSIS